MSRTLPLLSVEPGVHWPGVSVIVAARNAAATLPACLESLLALDYPDVEILVVDDRSVDETAAIAQAAGVRVLASPRSGPSAARNVALGAATHEIVAFTDADCVVPVHWLRALVEGLRLSRAAGVGGPQRNVFPPRADRSASDLDLFFSLASVVAEYTRTDPRPREVPHNASCNAAYIKHTVVEAGGFAEDLFPGEDVDLDFRLRRLGYRCCYVPDAWIAHHRPGTREWFASTMRRYGRAQRALVERHGRFRPLHYVPWALAILGGLQLLWWPRQTRAVALAVDGALLAAGLTLLSRRVPVERWPAVLDYAALATREWHRGYLEGLPRP
jgi:glycosyltransferase involved in cell wall biosynthesis